MSNKCYFYWPYLGLVLRQRSIMAKSCKKKCCKKFKKKGKSNCKRCPMVFAG
jgi:hypothetical protein